MAEIHKAVSVAAPVEKVFDFVDDPDRITSYTPNVERVENVQRTDQRVGDTFNVIYKVMGMTLDEKFTVAEYQRPARLVSHVEGRMKGTFAWSFAPEGEGTRASIDVHYELAGGPLGKAVDAL